MHVHTSLYIHVRALTYGAVCELETVLNYCQ